MTENTPMTVGELIEKLRDFDQNSIVLIYSEDCAIHYEPLKAEYINQDSVELYDKNRKTYIRKGKVHESFIKAVLFG